MKPTSAPDPVSVIIGPFDLYWRLLLVFIAFRIFRWAYKRACCRSRSRSFIQCRYCMAIILVMEKYDNFLPLHEVTDQAMQLTETLSTVGFDHVELVSNATREKISQIKHRVILPRVHGIDNSLLFVYYMGRGRRSVSASNIPSILPSDAPSAEEGIDANSLIQMLAPYSMPESFYVPEPKVVVFLDFRGPPEVPALQDPVNYRRNSQVHVPYYVSSRGPRFARHDASSFFDVFLTEVEKKIALSEVVRTMSQHCEDELIVESSAEFPAERLCLAQLGDASAFDTQSLRSGSTSDVTEEMQETRSGEAVLI